MQSGFHKQKLTCCGADAIVCCSCGMRLNASTNPQDAHLKHASVGGVQPRFLGRCGLCEGTMYVTCCKHNHGMFRNPWRLHFDSLRCRHTRVRAHVYISMYICMCIWAYARIRKNMNKLTSQRVTIYATCSAILEWATWCFRSFDYCCWHLLPLCGKGVGRSACECGYNR